MEPAGLIHPTPVLQEAPEHEQKAKQITSAVGFRHVSEKLGWRRGTCWAASLELTSYGHGPSITKEEGLVGSLTGELNWFPAAETVDGCTHLQTISA